MEKEIKLNGKLEPLPADTSLTGLLERHNLQNRPVLVELNGQALPPRTYAETELQAGDVVEIIRIVAGG